MTYDIASIISILNNYCNKISHLFFCSPGKLLSQLRQESRKVIHVLRSFLWDHPWLHFWMCHFPSFHGQIPTCSWFQWSNQSCLTINCPFLDDFSIEAFICEGFSVAMLNKTIWTWILGIFWERVVYIIQNHMDWWILISKTTGFFGSEKTRTWPPETSWVAPWLWRSVRVVVWDPTRTAGNVHGCRGL